MELGWKCSSITEVSFTFLWFFFNPSCVHFCFFLFETSELGVSFHSSALSPDPREVLLLPPTECLDACLLLHTVDIGFFPCTSLHCKMSDHNFKVALVVYGVNSWIRTEANHQSEPYHIQNIIIFKCIYIYK